MRSSSQNDKAEDKRKVGECFVGTAGYSYPHWKGVFYPKHVTQSQQLRHYSGVFAAVEINASFHAVPREETIINWADTVKEGFLFSFKVPQHITHEKRLERIDDSLLFFLNRLKELRRRCMLGPILFQLPPSFVKDVNKLEYIHQLMQPHQDGPNSFQLAFEFRNKSWYCQEVYDAMKAYNFGLVENISPDQSTCRVSKEVVTAGTWQYIRCHKRGDQTITDYSTQQLKDIAETLVERQENGIVQYCFFLNDHEGNGPRNAKTLVSQLKERSQKRPFLSTWKPDAVENAISKLFEKSSKLKSSTAKAIGSRKETVTESTKSRKRTIDSFFLVSSTATDTERPATTLKSRAPDDRRPNNSNKVKLSSKKGTITSFFSPK